MSTMEKGEANIRPMERKDILHALAIFRRITGGRSMLTYRDLISSDLGGAFDLSFVAELDGKIVGFVLARLTYVGVRVTLLGTIQSVAVDPDYRRRHIAASLIGTVLDRCYVEGVDEVRAVLDERDRELGNFVESLGFHRTELITYTKMLET